MACSLKDEDKIQTHCALLQTDKQMTPLSWPRGNLLVLTVQNLCGVSETFGVLFSWGTKTHPLHPKLLQMNNPRPQQWGHWYFDLLMYRALKTVNHCKVMTPPTGVAHFDLGFYMVLRTIISPDWPAYCTQTKKSTTPGISKINHRNS